jgi:hypothetical protein
MGTKVHACCHLAERLEHAMARRLEPPAAQRGFPDPLGALRADARAPLALPFPTTASAGACFDATSMRSLSSRATHDARNPCSPAPGAKQLPSIGSQLFWPCSFDSPQRAGRLLCFRVARADSERTMAKSLSSSTSQTQRRSERRTTSRLTTTSTTRQTKLPLR